MTIRENIEELELRILSPFAACSRNSKGRDRMETECDIRTMYQRDRDRIVHSKAFRRLKDKTQVFLSPQGDHYRTRLTHSMEVSQTARTIAKALRLNEDLVEAIALGHDLGHTPFGHAGEAALNSVCPDGFTHYRQSVRVVEHLEKRGRGLNLTWEVRDGILNHKMSGNPSTLEGQVVQLCDKIAYIHHDLDDAQRAGIICVYDIPQELRAVLGDTIKGQLNTLVHDIVLHSRGIPRIEMSEDVRCAMLELRKWMFRNIYKSAVAAKEEEKAKTMIIQLYEYYIEHPEKMSKEYYDLITVKEETISRTVCDYISGMTDQYSIAKYKEIFIPKSWERY